MKVDRQSVPSLAPFTPNVGFDNRPPRPFRPDVADVPSKCPIKMKAGPRASCNYRTSNNKRKENASRDPVRSIDKIISDCEAAVQQYASEVPIRADRSLSFKAGSRPNILNGKCRALSKGRDSQLGLPVETCTSEECGGGNSREGESRRRNPPTRKKSLKIMYALVANPIGARSRGSATAC